MTDEQKLQRAIELRNAIQQIMGKVKMAKHEDSPIKEAEKRLLFMLANVYHGEPVRPSELAKKMGVTLPAVSHHINGLEKQGYIERLFDPSDKRVVLVTLSDKGHQLNELFKERFLERFQELVEYLGKEDAEDLIRLIGKIEGFMSQKNDTCS